MYRQAAAAAALLGVSLGALPLAARDNGRGASQAATTAATANSSMCKSTAGQSAVDCPLIFAPGSTSPKTHTTNQPVPTANQVPVPHQHPTTSSIPMKVVAPTHSIRSDRGAAAASDTGSAAASAVMAPAAAPPPPPPPPPSGAPQATAAPLPAVGTVITSKPPLTAEQEIAGYGSFDAGGNFVLNPGVALNQPTNFVQVQANGKVVRMNVGQVKLFLSRGIMNRDGSTAADSPLTVNHVSPAPTATQFPPGTRMVPLDHVSASGSTQNIMPGGAGIPLAGAELGRIGVSGGGAPVDPQGLTSFYIQKIVDGQTVYVQMTQQQVATVVKSGMLKPDGSWQTKGEGLNQGTGGREGGDLHPTVVFLPPPPAPRAPMTPPPPGAPQAPPQQAYNVPTPMAVPPTPQQLTPPSPGAPKAPPLMPAEVPTLKPGFVAYPHYAGPRDPNTGYPVPPSPPQQLTPPTPGAPQAPPRQAYNVPTPMAVPPMPPQLTPPPPDAPQAPPLAKPYNVPSLAVPGQVVDVPRPRPLTVSAQRPAPPTTAAPAGVPSSSPTSAPATGNVLVSPKGKTAPIGPALITAQSGRQAAHATPTFEAKETGDRWHCVASGHRVRKAFDAAGNEFYAGALPGIGVSAVAMVRDVPAWHDLSTDCLIAVGEHPKARDARR